MTRKNSRGARAAEKAPKKRATGGGKKTAPLWEGARERLLRLLNDALSVEDALLDEFQNMADEVTDPELRAILQEHRRITHRQKQDLEARLQALGKEPSGGKGFFNQMVTRVWDALHRPRDGADKTLQHLIKGLSAGHFEAALYQVLGAYAGEVGDGETAALAARHLAQKRETAERLGAFIGPAVAAAARPPEPGP